ncbi:MAG: 2-amino-4-hydroxy-6-hydroxymethyldihydropteridine diphosphokinase [Chloroflexota bacterium]
MVETYVGLGSNLGDRERMVREAFERLARAPGVHEASCSSLYATEPWGFADQPPFINAVARLTTDLGPVQWFCVLRRIEGDMGRTRTFRWGPREIDLDLLLYGDRQIQRRGLTVPHPSMHQRAFVLAPLHELCPDYRSPSGATIDEMLDALEAGPSVARRE